jgi:hypothetical protein
MERLKLIAAVTSFGLLTACATRAPRQQAAVESPPPAASSAAPTLSPSHSPRYRCDHEIEFTVRFDDGSAQVDAGAHGSDTLLRDAGGTTPQQTVYSSTSMKAEFGLGADGREATLNIASPPLQAHCVRE